MKFSSIKILFLCAIIVSCSKGSGAIKFLGIPMGYTTWGIYSEEQALSLYGKEYGLSEQEQLRLLEKKHITGIKWGVAEGDTMESLDQWQNNPLVGIGKPIKKEKLLDSKYSEKWTYPYAFIYFKKNKVSNVEFRHDQIKKIKGPVKLTIQGIYK